jgi:hypothetical protein
LQLHTKSLSSRADVCPSEFVIYQINFCDDSKIPKMTQHRARLPGKSSGIGTKVLPF